MDSLPKRRSLAVRQDHVATLDYAVHPGLIEGDLGTLTQDAEAVLGWHCALVAPLSVRLRHLEPVLIFGAAFPADRPRGPHHLTKDARVVAVACPGIAATR